MVHKLKSPLAIACEGVGLILRIARVRALAWVGAHLAGHDGSGVTKVMLMAFRSLIGTGNYPSYQMLSKLKLQA